ncbi:MAG TPA: GGDEF domain-containing protein, partial [Bryobacteraceae bacterium]|nr:GGDEF domain-containing protein [Bryobacteraceae bacterium]
LLRMTETDPLTGLLNRRRFETVLQQMEPPFSLLMIDVNDFKRCNDTFGHKAGDEVLKKIASILTASARPADHCVRLGGDEFCVLMPGADRKTAARLSEAIEQSVFEAAIANTNSTKVGVSIGQATSPVDGTNPDDLVTVADRSMFAVKRRGERLRIMNAANREPQFHILNIP